MEELKKSGLLVESEMKALEADIQNIASLEEEIKSLRAKEIELLELRKKYYKDYFEAQREEYALLTGFPSNPVRQDEHVLFRHSVLNVDEIGKIICELFQKYEGRKMLSQRSTQYIMSINEVQPILVVGTPENISEGNKSNDNIVIDYTRYLSMNDYPTDSPVTCYKSYNREEKWTNYNSLIFFSNNLTFDYKGYEFIKELIFSLAYYQRQHDIKYMTAEETKRVSQKIFKL